MFDSTLKVALAVALEQSPFLKVFPDERAHEDLLLMQRSPDEGITRALARQIAQREQLKALVAGSITSLGRHYVVGLEAVNAESGDVMAREQVEAASKEEVLTSLGAAVSRLRRKLGESLASIQRYDVPLPQATTPSLEALQAYALRARSRPDQPAPRVDSASEAGHRARSELCARPGAALRHLRQHRAVGARAGVVAQGLRTARPRQRTRTVFHLVALLPRCHSGVGQGARARPILDGRVSERIVRVQQRRVRGVGARAVSAGDRAASRIDPTRSEVHRADVESRVRR